MSDKLRETYKQQIAENLKPGDTLRWFYIPGERALKKMTYYAISDFNVIVYTPSMGMNTCVYERIESMSHANHSRERSSVTFYLKDEKPMPTADVDDFFLFQFVNIPREELKEIYHWVYTGLRRQTRYRYVDDKLNLLANKYKLNYVPCRPPLSDGNDKVADLWGDIEGMDFALQIRNILAPITLRIGFDCPNPEDNAFLISRETFGQKLKILLGNQDIKIGHKKIDKKFRFQSDNSSFFKCLFTEEVQQIINYKFKYELQEIIFGSRENLKKITRVRKAKSKNDEHILDAHLLEPEDEKEIGRLEELEEDNRSFLQYEHRIVNKTIGGQFASDLEQIVELVIALGKEIKKYYVT